MRGLRGASLVRSLPVTFLCICQANAKRTRRKRCCRRPCLRRVRPQATGAVHLCPNVTVADRRYSQSREEIVLSIFARCFVGLRHFREKATYLSTAAGKTLSRILLGRRWH